MEKYNNNNNLTKTDITQFNKELLQQQRLLHLHTLGQYRHIFFSTTSKEKESDISINNRIMIEKIKKAVHKELLQVLAKAGKSTNRLPNPITISEKEATFAPCDDFIQQTLGTFVL